MRRFPTASAALLLLFAVTAGSCISHTKQRKKDLPLTELATDGKGLIIRITDRTIEAGGSDTVRFGRLHSGETAILSLWLANETEHPIVLTDYRRSCGCTALEFTAQPIAPDHARQLPLTFDSRGEWGWQLKTIDLVFAESACGFRLFVEAEVE